MDDLMVSSATSVVAARAVERVLPSPLLGVGARPAERPIYWLYCDEPGCVATFETDSLFAATREAGWDFPAARGDDSRYGMDFCPQHAEDGAS